MSKIIFVINQEHSNDSSCLQVTVCRPLMEMEFEIKEASLDLIDKKQFITCN